ncbi:TadE/TadG family type IV pilus assembly protein [Streptomyces sp. SBT349]|uniref:TadE/TadG family type IV pilus assembly protein n=1 Tax=Streptomyces sp. SBT349 TaxID=1580539 RepID=UPI00066C55A2|nr:TadE/TadG family type IV pilus assembly protein [Streptomyces sp. SBT349]
MHAAPQPPTSDTGSATVELVLLTPLLILLVLLAVGFGRLTDARIRVEDAAHHAARAASLTHTGKQAERAAQDAAAAALDASGAGCASHTVELNHQRLVPGSAVTATVSCHSDLRDLLGTGLPGALTLSAGSTSPIDTYRSTP